MQASRQIFWVCTLCLIAGACNYLTYTPRSKKNIQREKPPVILFYRIVDFRTEQNRWPVSKQDFISQGKKYMEAFAGSSYNYTQFKVKDSNTMTFYFSNHIKDAQNYNETGLIDLNSYHGRAKFYKENNKFIWKVKMK